MSRSILCVAFALSSGLLLQAVPALAQVPDPARSSVPPWIYVVGRLDGGASPDPVGIATVTLRDFANQPLPNALVEIDFSGCCDIHLCAAEVNGQNVDCSSRIVSGRTNQAGQFTFSVMGAAGDPGNRTPPDQYPGCGLSGVQVRGEMLGGMVVLGNSTAVCLDLNGGAGQSSGTTGADVSNLATLVGSVALGAPYRGRGDVNRSGTVTGADAAALAAHVGRLILSNAVGCTDLCVMTGCP